MAAEPIDRDVGGELGILGFQGALDLVKPALFAL
jgi:hypothetical protein